MKCSEQGASGVREGSGRYIVSVILLAATYFATGKLGLLLASPLGNATAVWPPSGIALAAVVLLGQRVWPGIWFGATLVSATTHATLITSAVLGLGNTLEAMLAAYLLRRFVGSQDLFQRGKDVFVFGGLVAGLSCTVAATIGVTSLWLGGSLPASGYASNWLTWWLGDAAGMIVVTPLVLTWFQAPRMTWNAALRAEWLIVAAALLAAGLAIFLQPPLADFPHPRPFMLLPLLGWAAFRFSQRETATAVAMIVGMAIGGTVLGVGPFYHANMLNRSLLHLQAFVSIVAMTSLALAAAVAERRELETALRQVRNDLERRVCERTAELARANDSLQAEIVERKRMEQALAEGERKYRDVVETSHDLIWAVDEHGRITFINQAARRIYGYDPEEMIGRPFTDFLLPGQVPAEVNALQRMLATNEPVINHETQVLRRDGSVVFLSANAVILRDRHGNPVGTTGTSQDVTERKRAEEALLGSEARYRSLFENSLDGVLLTAPDGRILAANPEACRIFGRTEEELRQVGRAGVVDMTDPRLAVLLEERSRTGRCRGELIHLRGDGATFEGEISSAVFTDRDGSLRTSMIIRDITERKRAEEGLRESEANAVQLGQENAIMAEIGRIIGSTLDFEEVYEGFSEEVKKMLPFDRIVINVIDAEKGVVKNVYIAGEPLQDRNVQDTYPLQGSGNAEMVRTQSSLLIQAEDFTEYRDRFPSLVSTFDAGFRSILNVPLFSKGNLIGGLLLRSRQPFAYTEKDVRLAERIGSLIAGAVANARLFEAAQREIVERKRAEEALRQRTRQLEAIRAVTAEITRELEPTALLRLITQRAAELVGVASGTVWFWDEEAQLLVPKAWHGSSDWRGEVRLRLGEGVAGRIAQRREGLIANNYRHSPYALPFFLERTDVTALMGEPLIYRDRLLGVIMIDNSRTGRPFTEQDRETLALFAGQAAIAIENARLHSSALERGTQLKALLRASRSVLSGLKIEETLRHIVEEAAEISGTPHVKLILVDEHTRQLRLGAIAGRPPRMLADFQLALGTGLSGLVAGTGQPLYVSDCQHDARNLYAEHDRELGLVTYLGLPIRTRDDVVGVLTFNTTQPREYAPEETAYLASFADQAAIAIENARQHETEFRRARQLAMLNELGQDLTKLLEPAKVAQEVVTAIVRLMPGSICRLWERGDSENTVRLVASAGLRESGGGSGLFVQARAW